jgi:mannan endo-1,4-beta-mannosidase
MKGHLQTSARKQVTRRRWPIAAGALAVLAAVTACGHPAARPGIADPVAVPLAPQSGRYLGYAGPASGLAGFTALAGARPDMMTQYVQPTASFTAPPAGVTPLVSLATTQAPAVILSGADDQRLTALGRQLAAYGKPVAVSVDPEGNGPWYSYGTRHAGPGQYIAVYRHVHDVITRAGALNVIWVWTISNSQPITHESLLDSLYPGDAYVDWIGVDGYFLGSESSYQQVFTRVFNEVRGFTGRPFLVTETSVQPGPHAAQWVQELFRGIESDPAVVGFVWFDYDKVAENRDDWRLEDDPAAAAAFPAAAPSYRKT